MCCFRLEFYNIECKNNKRNVISFNYFLIYIYTFVEAFMDS